MGSFLDNMKKLSGGPRRFAAVDFDGRQLRIVHAERVANRTRILKLASVAMPEGLDQENPKAFGELISRTLQDMRLGNVGVLMNVPRGQAVLKPVTLPPGTPPGELANMVQFQVEKELPFRPEEAVIDFTVERHYDVQVDQTQTPAAGIDVLVGAVRLPVVDHYRRIAEAAGVKLLRLGIRPYANLRCVDACTRRGPHETLLVVHIGADETEIDMLVGKSLLFSRSAAVKLPQVGFDADQAAPYVEAVAMEVARSVQSFQAVERASKIDAILVAGGSGLERLVAERLAGRLGTRCELFDPAAALRLGEAPDASAFISALGLAIGHYGAEQLPFDFLNPKRPRVRRNMTKILSIGAAAAVILALTVGIAAGAIHLGRKQDRIDELKSEMDMAKTQNKQLVRLKSRMERIREWSAGGHDWLTHWAYITAIFPSCNDAYIGGLKTSSDGSMSFTVKARDSKIISDLDKRLLDAGYSFKLGRLATAHDPFGYSYSVDIRVVVDDKVKLDLASVRPIPRPEDDDSANQLMQAAKKAAAATAAAPATAADGTPAAPAGAGDSAAPAAPTQATIVNLDGSAATGGGDAAALESLRAYTMRRYDQNHDGQLNRSEYKYLIRYAYQSNTWRRAFDANKNGQLEDSERQAMQQFLQQLRGPDGGEDE